MVRRREKETAELRRLQQERTAKEIRGRESAEHPKPFTSPPLGWQEGASVTGEDSKDSIVMRLNPTTGATEGYMISDFTARFQHEPEASISISLKELAPA